MHKIIEDMHNSHPDIMGWILSHEYPDYMQYRKGHFAIAFAPEDMKSMDWEKPVITLSIQTYECESIEIGDWDSNDDCFSIEHFELTVENLQKQLLPLIEKYEAIIIGRSNGNN